MSSKFSEKAKDLYAQFDRIISLLSRLTEIMTSLYAEFSIKLFSEVSVIIVIYNKTDNNFTKFYLEMF